MDHNRNCRRILLLNENSYVNIAKQYLTERKDDILNRQTLSRQSDRDEPQKFEKISKLLETKYSYSNSEQMH